MKGEFPQRLLQQTPERSGKAATFSDCHCMISQLVTHTLFLIRLPFCEQPGQSLQLLRLSSIISGTLHYAVLVGFNQRGTSFVSPRNTVHQFGGECSMLRLGGERSNCNRNMKHNGASVLATDSSISFQDVTFSTNDSFF